MIEEVETLAAIKKHKTMSTAASYLRVSQSAVSKRIAQLESRVGVPLLERRGRYVVLTEAGEKLISQTQPHLEGIKRAIALNDQAEKIDVKLGVSESILGSWGARLLRIVKSELAKSTNLELHAHRGALIVEKVSSGELDIGLCAGKVPSGKGLHKISLGREQMVWVGNKSNEQVIAIEKSSLTWKSISSRLDSKGFIHLESFFAITQMANQGVAMSLVPEGMVEALKIRASLVSPDRPKIYRPIQLIAKKSWLVNSRSKEVIDAVEFAYKNLKLGES